YADIHFIFMSREMEGQGFPSKVYTILACSKPLLVISGKHTPIHNFLTRTNCAFLIDSETLDEKCERIVDILKNVSINRSDLERMGADGFELIEKQYSKNAVTQQYVDLADQLLI
uniref:hypothetical protein n=1 Tax=Pedobacter panaciterrae TaxID=363849 RepID=UPI003F6900A0